jgi:hypothetical protein
VIPNLLSGKEEVLVHWLLKRISIFQMMLNSEHQGARLRHFPGATFFQKTNYVVAFNPRSTKEDFETVVKVGRDCGTGWEDMSRSDCPGNLKRMEALLSILSTIIHEARHSDGVMHVRCEGNHPQKDLEFAACDDSLDGSYGVTFAFINVMVYELAQANRAPPVLAVALLEQWRKEYRGKRFTPRAFARAGIDEYVVYAINIFNTIYSMMKAEREKLN